MYKNFTINTLLLLIITTLFLRIQYKIDFVTGLFYCSPVILSFVIQIIKLLVKNEKVQKVLHVLNVLVFFSQFMLFLLFIIVMESLEYAF